MRGINAFHAFMIKNGFRRSKADPCIHIKNKKSGIPIVAIWVDDGFIAGSSFLELLRSEFKITERPLDSFMGIQVRERENGYFVSQRAYVEKILQRFCMSDCNPVKTPAEKIHENKIDKSSLDKSIPYRSAVGSHMYLACATRPDIAYAVSKVARSMAAPTTLEYSNIRKAPLTSA